MPPRRPQELSKRSQDGPKSSQDAPNSGPRVPKIPPRPSQERPRGLQYRPESAQKASKAPRGLQDRPKSAQDASKTAQDASKTAPRAPILLSSRFPDSKSKRTPLPRCFLPLKVCGGTRAASYNTLKNLSSPRTRKATKPAQDIGCARFAVPASILSQIRHGRFTSSQGRRP